MACNLFHPCAQRISSTLLQAVRFSVGRSRDLPKALIWYNWGGFNSHSLPAGITSPPGATLAPKRTNSPGKLEKLSKAQQFTFEFFHLSRRYLPLQEGNQNWILKILIPKSYFFLLKILRHGKTFTDRSIGAKGRAPILLSQSKPIQRYSFSRTRNEIAISEDILLWIYCQFNVGWSEGINNPRRVFSVWILQ